MVSEHRLQRLKRLNRLQLVLQARRKRVANLVHSCSHTLIQRELEKAWKTDSKVRKLWA